jgi:hypothetical protein
VRRDDIFCQKKTDDFFSRFRRKSRLGKVSRDVGRHGDAAQALLLAQRRRRVPADDRHQLAKLNKQTKKTESGFFCFRFQLLFRSNLFLRNFRVKPNIPRRFDDIVFLRINFFLTHLFREFFFVFLFVCLLSSGFNYVLQVSEKSSYLPFCIA